LTAKNFGGYDAGAVTKSVNNEVWDRRVCFLRNGQ
jgi:hypothetical protein